MSTQIKIQAYHEDRDLFKEAILHTARSTGFGAVLVEKDYFCSLILSALYKQENNPLIFKGGTCLSKIHAEFYRLSEDLDFMISVKSEATKNVRSQCMKPLKQLIENLSKTLPLFSVQPLVGHNESRQYTTAVVYRSEITGQESAIKVEIGLREPVLCDVENKKAHTILEDPFSQRKVFDDFSCRVLSLQETYAEKIRAALARRDIAIRDFYDVFHAVKNRIIETENREFIDLVKRKIDMPGNDPVDLSDERISSLKRQLTTELRVVLRETDFQGFNLDEAITIVRSVRDLLT